MPEQSVLTRMALGVTIGVFLGVIAFVVTPLISGGRAPMLPWGFLLWYATLGAVIAIVTLVDWPWSWLPPGSVAGAGVGAWFNFVVCFFAYDDFGAIMTSVLGQGGASPFWYVAEGAVAGGLIGWVCTRYGQGARSPGDI